MASTRCCVVCGVPLIVRKYYDKSGRFKGYGQSFNKVTCSRACTNVYRSGIDLEERFWGRVDKSGGPDACWPFLGNAVKGGYGRMKWGESLELTHRIAWSLANEEPIPESDVLHTCDNPPCCNPAHLFLGNHDDNMTDMVNKGRSSRKYGERNGRAEVTEAQVREIRMRYHQESITQTKLAAEYGLSQPTISQIIKRKLWSHID